MGTPVAVAVSLVVPVASYLGGRAALPRLAAGYTRGFADTVLRYTDRSYDGAKWVRLKASAALASLARPTGSASTLFSIAGRDEGNFWVATQSGTVYRKRDDAWRVECQLRNAFKPIIRPVDGEHLFVAGENFHRVSAGEVERLGEARNPNWSWGGRIAPLAADRVYSHGLTIDPDVLYRYEGQKRSQLRRDEYREATVHDADGTPLRDHGVEGVNCTRSFAAGGGYGVAQSRGHDETHARLVRYAGKFWRTTSDDDLYAPRDMWLTGSTESPAVVVVGGESSLARGWVHVRRTLAAGVDHRLAGSLEPTSTDLLRVWGVSPDKYWVMDTNGTVWQRDGAESRVVIRGLRREQVQSHDAWVSPTGAVYASTEDRLDKLG